MKYLSIFIFVTAILLYFTGVSTAQSKFSRITADDNTKFTNVGNIGITLTNYGVYGDAFVEQSPIDQPSCEYPRGSGIEHMFDGGLWIGALTPAGEKVSTGAFNAARVQSSGSINFEFTNTADPTDLIVERSSIEIAKFFDPNAVSHQDFIAEFSDTNLFVPGTGIQIPFHDPLGVAVHLETYAWNFPFADAFVIFNYTLTNVWDDTLKDVYVGLWADLVVRNTNILPPRVGGPFYQDVKVGFIDNDTTKMIYAFEPSGGGRYTDANSYVSLVYLGATPQRSDTLYKGKANHNWWMFSGGTEPWQIAPSSEAARYQVMSQSLPDAIYEQEILPAGGSNYMSLITTGPFEYIMPDSSINVVFAIVCGKRNASPPHNSDTKADKKNLLENISWAQRAYYGEDTNRNGILDYVGTDSTEDVIPNGILDRYILPTPPTPPRVKAIIENSKVTLLWDKTAEKSIDLISKVTDFEGYRVYRSFLGNDISGTGIFDNMRLVQEFDRRDGLFYDTGLESIALPEPIVEIGTDPNTGLPDTVEYFYRLEFDGLHNGWQYAFAITAFDSGDVDLNLNSLESSRLQNAIVVTPGTPPNTSQDNLKVGVYPNPYRADALWDGGLERERKLFFYNLPRNAEVRIYTLAGDMVDSFTHHGESYTGRDIKWYETFSDANNPTIFAGGEHAWDLVTKSDQAIATGLYLFTVKDLDSGDIQRGKFVVIK